MRRVTCHVPLCYRCAFPHVDMSMRRFTHRCAVSQHRCAVSQHPCAVSHIDVPFHLSMCRFAHQCAAPRIDIDIPFYILHIDVQFQVSTCRYTCRCAVSRIDVSFHISIYRFTYRCAVPHIDIPFHISYSYRCACRSHFRRANTASRARADENSARRKIITYLHKLQSWLGITVYMYITRGHNAHTKHQQERPQYQNPADHFIAPKSSFEGLNYLVIFLLRDDIAYIQ